MGQVLKVDDDVLAQAAELSAMTGETLDQTVTRALRLGIDAAQREHLAQEKARKALAEFHDLLENPRPGSDHGWMYDDDGLPIW